MSLRRTLIAALLLPALMVGVGSDAWGATLILDDGSELVGRIVKVAGVADDPNSTKPMAGEVKVQPILLVDDGLRRTYVWQRRVVRILEQKTEKPVRIRIWQNVASRGGAVGSVGRRVSETPFDKYGRRIYTMMTGDGPLPVIQGITEITPVYTKIEGLLGAQRPIVWDMRLATTSIPPAILSEILHEAIDSTDVEARREIVRFYSQSARYREARDELEQMIVDFPEIAEDSRDVLRQLRQLAARMILNEVELRRKAGQHELVQGLLARFPDDEVAGETLQQVREILNEYQQLEARRKHFLEQLAVSVGGIVEPVHKKLSEEFLAEVTDELTYTAMDRTAAFLRLADDQSLTAEQKTALAMSGWLLGSNDATDTFAVAVSLFEVRRLVGEFLREPEAAKRAALLTEIRDQEGGTPERVAQILKHMRPPEEVPEGTELAPGYYELGVELPAPGGLVRYLVQLPPSYDPLRQYPTIVTLNGEGYTPELQLDYWAGSVQGNTGRRGQAMRHGYITIAIDWQEPHQFEYKFSLREHQAVLGALRDAQRRFSIDTARTFLTGHGIGGDAAWDMGLAHPDLWAGVIPFLSAARKYTSRYRENGKLVDWYFVGGERDGGKMEQNATEFDRYLRPGYNATVVEYLGRGNEPYHDEIQRLFDWMNRRTRRPVPTEFTCATMRPWDNFFWWLELSELSENSMVHPNTWPPARGQRPMQINAKIFDNNKIVVRTGAKRGTVWLSPEVVNFDEPLTVEVNGRRLGTRDRVVRPELGVLLEDARTRCDRQHPYWAKLTTD